MKALSIFLLIASAVGYSGNSCAQSDARKYKPRIGGYRANVLRPITPGSVTHYAIDEYAELIYSREYNADSVEILLEHNGVTSPQKPNMASISSFYFISKNDLNAFFKPMGTWEIGVLSVPFKMRVDPIKFMAGNSIGPCIGYRMGNIQPLAFASLTNVPLNDMNESVPQTKWGLGAGAGVVAFVKQDFQIGLIGGVDLFEGVEDWYYGFRPWFSVSIGYSFYRANKPERQAIQSAR